MAHRNCKTNFERWLTIGFAAFFVTAPLGVIGALRLYDVWRGFMARESAILGWSDRNFSGHGGFSTQGLAAGLRLMSEWTRVAIKSVTLTEDDAADLAMCEQLRVVQFHDCTFEAGALARLGRHRNLRALVIGACRGSFQELREFAHSGSLASLEFFGCSIPLAAATAIGEIGSLERLGFARCTLDRSCIQAFKTLARLSDLRIIDSPLATHDLEDLSLLPTLRFLDISRTMVGDDFIPTIQRMQRLREIDVGAFPHPPAFTADGIERLRRLCPHLILTNYPNLWGRQALYCGSTYSVPWADD